MWHGRVVIPRLYEISGGFTYGTFEYTLPAYVKPPFRVQIKSNTYNLLMAAPVENETNYTWHDFAGYEVEPATDGSWLLRLPTTPYSESARIIWWQENGSMPTSTVTLLTAMDTDDTNVAITEEDLYIPDNGFIKIEDEWVAYAGKYNDGTEQRCQNAIRGYGESTAASHSGGATMEWGVAVDDQRLWVQLYDYVAAYIHGLQMHKSTGEDISRHEKLMSFFSRRAEEFWRTSGYISQRKSRRLLTSSSLGGISW